LIQESVILCKVVPLLYNRLPGLHGSAPCTTVILHSLTQKQTTFNNKYELREDRWSIYFPFSLLKNKISHNNSGLICSQETRGGNTNSNIFITLYSSYNLTEVGKRTVL